jgi:hypothetical protein
MVQLRGVLKAMAYADLVRNEAGWKRKGGDKNEKLTFRVVPPYQSPISIIHTLTLMMATSLSLRLEPISSTYLLIRL